MPKPTLYEICTLLHCPPLDLGHEPIAGAVTDSREGCHNKLFVALKGANVDGHDYLEQAFNNGAIAALVRDDYPSQDPRLIKVKDPLLALQAIARSHIAKSKAQVVAVTGSLGKTTTKEFLYSILKTKYRTACTSGNQNSQVGMSVSLLNNVVGDEECIVVEMGMTEAGHIKRLVDIVPPNLALITSIALVHAMNFQSIEGIAHAKAEIFSHPSTLTTLINKDSECSSLLQKLAHDTVLTYSMQDPSANFYMAVTPDGLLFNGQILPYIYLPAPHVYLNLLAACAVASCCEMSAAEIGNALHNIQMPEKRLEPVIKANITFINDSYNAAEPSLKAALSYIQVTGKQKRKVAVIGQMRELGQFSISCHKAVGEHAIECVDRIYCLGEECEPIVSVCKEANRYCRWFTDFSELVDVLKNELQEDDLVLLKGSRSNGLWRVLDAF